MAELAAEYDAGSTIQQVARRHRVGYSTMRRYLLAAGVNFRPKPPAPPPGGRRGVVTSGHRRRTAAERDALGDIVSDLYQNQGWALEPLASRFGITPYTLRQMIMDRGGMLDSPHGTGLTLTPQARAELVRRYRSGAAIKDLAADYHTSEYRIRDTLRAAGVNIRTSRSAGQGRYTGAEREQVKTEMARLYQTGASTRAIASQYQVCHATVRTLLHEAGVTLRPRTAGSRIGACGGAA